MLLHATTIAIQDQAILLTGPSGVGKSDLALRLIDGGAQLVADDQTELSIEDNRLIASAPASIQGLIEVRHIGLMRLPFMQKVMVVLQVDCITINDRLERLPEADTIFLLDHPVPRLRLLAFASSTPAKIRAFLTYPLVTDK